MEFRATEIRSASIVDTGTVMKQIIIVFFMHCMNFLYFRTLEKLPIPNLNVIPPTALSPL